MPSMLTCTTSRSGNSCCSVSFAARHSDDPRTLLLMAPGWVQTDLGGSDASLTVEQSTRGVADVLEAQAGAGGLQFLDYRGQTVPW